MQRKEYKGFGLEKSRTFFPKHDKAGEEWSFLGKRVSGPGFFRPDQNKHKLFPYFKINLHFERVSAQAR